MSTTTDLAIIGGGIIGCASALAIMTRNPGLKITLFEKESHLAGHQTGHNSGVIHAGLYYRPGSLKASTCCSGREALYRFCSEHSIPYQRCGKVVVAVDETEVPALEELERRYIYKLLDRFDDSRDKTAETLGINKSTLWRKLQQYKKENL